MKGINCVLENLNIILLQNLFLPTWPAPFKPMAEATSILPTSFFKRFWDRPEGDEWAIDVYTAVDMGICGLLAYRSALNGNVPVKVPNLRNKEERDAFRNDDACTNPKVAGDQLLPCIPGGNPEISDEVYHRVRRFGWTEKTLSDCLIPRRDEAIF